MTLSPGQLAWVTAQETHALIGILVVLLAALASPGNLAAVVIAAGGLIVITAWKEVFWDPAHETDQPFFWEGAQDFAFYLIGLGGGLLLLGLLHTLRGLPV